VALQALARFAKVASGNTNMKVNVVAGANSHDYSLTSANNLVLQSRVVSLLQLMYGF